VRVGSLAELVVIAERLGVLSKHEAATSASMNGELRTAPKDN
jgi:hypothetical protein